MNSQKLKWEKKEYGEKIKQKRGKDERDLFPDVFLKGEDGRTHQNPLYPAELDHSFGLGRLFGRSLLGRGQLLPVGETIFEWFLERREPFTLDRQNLTDGKSGHVGGC